MPDAASSLNVPAAGLTAGLAIQHYYVSATNQITVSFRNAAGGAIDEPSANWTYVLIP